MHARGRELAAGSLELCRLRTGAVEARLDCGQLLFIDLMKGAISARQCESLRIVGHWW